MAEKPWRIQSESPALSSGDNNSDVEDGSHLIPHTTHYDHFAPVQHYYNPTEHSHQACPEEPMMFPQGHPPPPRFSENGMEVANMKVGLAGVQGGTRTQLWDSEFYPVHQSSRHPPQPRSRWQSNNEGWFHDHVTGQQSPDFSPRISPIELPHCLTRSPQQRRYRYDHHQFMMPQNTTRNTRTPPPQIEGPKPKHPPMPCEEKRSSSPTPLDDGVGARTADAAAGPCIAPQRPMAMRTNNSSVSAAVQSTAPNEEPGYQHSYFAGTSELPTTDPNEWEELVSHLQTHEAARMDWRAHEHYHVDSSRDTWHTMQRQYQLRKLPGRTTPLSYEPKHSLTDMGLRWDVNSYSCDNEAQWYSRLEELREYRQRFGHCNVPTDDPTHKPLARWVLDQRAAVRANVKGTGSAGMTKRRWKALKEVGFVDHRLDSNSGEQSDATANTYVKSSSVASVKRAGSVAKSRKSTLPWHKPSRESKGTAKNSIAVVPWGEEA